MTMHSVSLDIASALGRPRTCAVCGSPRLAVTRADNGVVFTCRNCRGMWSPELGVLVPLEIDRAGDGQGVCASSHPRPDRPAS